MAADWEFGFWESLAHDGAGDENGDEISDLEEFRQGLWLLTKPIPLNTMAYFRVATQRS